MNAHKRLHGLIIDFPRLDFTTSAGPLVAESRDCTMNRLTRRGRASRSHYGRRESRPTLTRPARLQEGRQMNSQSTDTDVRTELVARVRQEIQDGTYDTPEKFDAALDRLADRLDRD